MASVKQIQPTEPIMRLYCYSYFPENILKEGYLSAANNPTPKQLIVYKTKANSEDFEVIKQYLESTFPGRTRSVCALTEYAPLEEYEHPYLNYLVHHAAVISFDVDELAAAGLLEAVYCKDCKEALKEEIEQENIYKLNSLEEIDVTPLDWHYCSEKYGSPYNVLRHYMLVLTKGYIPPEYIRLEIDVRRE